MGIIIFRTSIDIILQSFSDNLAQLLLPSFSLLKHKVMPIAKYDSK